MYRSNTVVGVNQFQAPSTLPQRNRILHPCENASPQNALFGGRGEHTALSQRTRQTRTVQTARSICVSHGHQNVSPRERNGVTGTVHGQLGACNAQIPNPFATICEKYPNPCLRWCPRYSGQSFPTRRYQGRVCHHGAKVGLCCCGGVARVEELQHACPGPSVIPSAFIAGRWDGGTQGGPGNGHRQVCRHWRRAAPGAAPWHDPCWCAGPPRHLNCMVTNDLTFFWSGFHLDWAWDLDFPPRSCGHTHAPLPRPGVC
jgi:hypothetical protein